MIRAFTMDDFELLLSWVPDEATLVQFSGPDWSFPIPYETVDTYLSNFPARQMYIAETDNGIPYAIGEIITQNDPSPRLARLLVGGNENRGKGLGFQLVSELIAECKKIHNPEIIYLYVEASNERAIRCYQKAGFRFDDTDVIVLEVKQWTHHIKRMSLRVEQVRLEAVSILF